MVDQVFKRVHAIGIELERQGKLLEVVVRDIVTLDQARVRLEQTLLNKGIISDEPRTPGGLILPK
jgi:chemotaxis regulatin CheY-phosphate phosphatase CheZ